MTKGKGRKFWGIGIGMAVILGLLFSGCASIQPKGSGSDSRKELPLYYDFGDVLVPKELKVDKKLSFIYRTAGLTTGVLTLSGRVELNSLIAFFENNMAKDNWQKLSEFKSPRTILLFQKEHRYCVINIVEGDFEAHVEIWVAPTMMKPDSGLIK
ncbi:MAG: hypothetical protein AB1659_09070 [Thermodesulfobacteriota bacterium]